MYCFKWSWFTVAELFIIDYREIQMWCWKEIASKWLIGTVSKCLKWNNVGKIILHVSNVAKGGETILSVVMEDVTALTPASAWSVHFQTKKTTSNPYFLEYQKKLLHTDVVRGNNLKPSHELETSA